jgi:hypothetical protein
MPKKIQNTTKAHLVSVPLPNHGATYTVISHQFVIDYAYQALANAGFGIVDEEYRCTADGQIAQGIYKLNFNNDPELSMMFAWTNSYNKQVKFKCVVGAYINNSGSVMISGEVGSWVRKHTGTADTEVKQTIDDYISNAYMYYNQLCSDKAAMEIVSLNKRKQSQLLGVLFAEYEILTTEQASLIRDQMKRPLQVFKSTDSLWAFYNFVTNALQSSHPKTWMEDQRILHYFIGTICDFSAPPQNLSAPVPDLSTPVEDPLYEDPNQTNILDQIAEVENLEQTGTNEDENEVILYQSEEVVQDGAICADDLHQSDEIIPDVTEDDTELIEDEIVQYVDPAGNTFEAPVVAPCAAHDAETEREIEQENLTDIFPQVKVDHVQLNETTVAAVIVTEATEDLDDAFAEADNFDLDFTETETEEDNSPDFF